MIKGRGQNKNGFLFVHHLEFLIPGKEPYQKEEKVENKSRLEEYSFTFTTPGSKSVYLPKPDRVRSDSYTINNISYDFYYGPPNTQYPIDLCYEHYTLGKAIQLITGHYGGRCTKARTKFSSFVYPATELRVDTLRAKEKTIYFKVVENATKVVVLEGMVI